jgi:ketosteroid isomerase-like protein
MSLMDASEIVRELWTRAQARDWDGFADLIAEDAVFEYPVSAERIVGRANYVAINREYPEGWEVKILRIVGTGEDAASEVEMPHETLGLFRVASFWTIKDGTITSGTDYWTVPGSDPRNPDRAQYVEPI